MTGNLYEAEATPALLRGEQALWRAVIMQALMDAASGSTKMEAQYEKSQARCWLSGFSEDFKTVCDLANFSPDYIRTRSAQALARNCKWRAEVRKPLRIPPTEQGEARSGGVWGKTPAHEVLEGV